MRLAAGWTCPTWRPSSPTRPPRSTSRTPATSASLSRARPRSVGWRATPARSPSPASIRSAWALSPRRAAMGQTSPSATCSRSGIHMAAGTGLSGFMAFRDEEAYLRGVPVRHLHDPRDDGARRAHLRRAALSGRTSYGVRDKAPDWVGTQTGLWAICAGVYLASMGPQGMREVGETILRRAHYAARRLAALPGVSACRWVRASSKSSPSALTAPARRSPRSIEALLERGIFGGRDLSTDYPQLGQSALYCVTEVHTRGDIDRLARRALGGARMSAIGGEQGGVHNEAVARRMRKKLERQRSAAARGWPAARLPRSALGRADRHGARAAGRTRRDPAAGRRRGRRSARGCTAAAARAATLARRRPCRRSASRSFSVTSCAFPRCASASTSPSTSARAPAR